MITLAAAAAGGLFGWYRGGPLKNRDEIVGRIKPKWLSKTVKILVNGDMVNALAFATFCVIVKGAEYHGMLHGGPVYALAAGTAALWLYCFAMMLRGSTPGWGEYIGAAGGWRPGAGEPLQPEVSYIDKLIKPLINRPVLWGMAGLSLRCGEWGLFIGAPFITFWPLVFGVLAGPLVFVLSKTLPHRFVWTTFEVILGVGLWAGIVL